MNKDRIWTLVSRKLSGEATASELGELARLIETQANTALYLQALEELWNVPVEKDEEFLEATYHLHLNRLKEKGFDLLTDKEDIHPLYFDVQTHAARQAKKDKLFFSLGMLFTIVLLIVMLYNFESPVKVLPSAAMPLMAGMMISRNTLACSVGVTIGAGEYAPIPPVLGPRSWSSSRL